MVRNTTEIYNKNKSQMFNAELNFKRYYMDNDCYKKLWIHCPICGGKTRVKITEITVLLNFPLFCPKCKKETVVDIVKLKMTVKK